MRLSDWFDDRTGYRQFVHNLLHEPAPDGLGWFLIRGRTLVFVFVLQAVTGILLTTAYSPSTTTAWSSVWYIQTQVTLGWLIRGLHHFGSQAMVVLLPLHIIRVVLAKAYRAPREVNWWVGIALMVVTLGLAHTGYQLPWDQKGFWATKIATNIMGQTPLIGRALQKTVMGGSDYGHQTLTRFFALHVIVFPAAFVLILAVHFALYRRNGIKAASLSISPDLANQESEQRISHFSLSRALRDSMVCGTILIVLVAIVCTSHLGYHRNWLDAPADPFTTNYPPRPEWYFLFLFQMLKYFENEALGAIGVPTAILTMFVLIPLLDKIMWKWLAHGIALIFVVGLFGGAAWLTFQAVRADHDPPDSVIAAIHEKQKTPDAKLSEQEKSLLRARQFNDQRRQATIVAERVSELAKLHGIPPSGPLELIAGDPVIRGPQLFAANCAACHRINGTDGLGTIPDEPQTSSDLAGFASRAWIRRLLDKPDSQNNFGVMKKSDGDLAHTRMIKWIKDQLEENETPKDRAALFANFEAVAAYLADESQRPGRLEKTPLSELVTSRPTTLPASAPASSPATTIGPEEALIRTGRAYFMNTCNECHSYAGERSGTVHAPEMRGYGSVEWIEKMIENPADDSLYRSTGKEPAQMPAFKDKLTPQERHLLAVWLHDTQIK